MNVGKISRKIFKILITAGVIILAASSPSFFANLLEDKKYKYSKKKIAWTFYYLKRRGMIKYKKIGKQVYISLTPEGKKRAQELQIDDLKIKIPQRWDGKWRILMFDISEKNRAVREALRGKFKELGLWQLQKSVWIYPYDCEKEFEILKTFFHLSDESFMFITATSIPSEENFKKFFNLK